VVELSLGKGDPAVRQRPLDHASSSPANHHPKLRILNPRQALDGQDDMERFDKIRGGIDERSVEIKDDDRCGHSGYHGGLLSRRKYNDARDGVLGTRLRAEA
jgi:hypothetical protein